MVTQLRGSFPYHSLSKPHPFLNFLNTYFSYIPQKKLLGSMNSLLREKFKAKFQSDVTILLNSLYQVLDHNVNIYILALEQTTKFNYNDIWDMLKQNILKLLLF